MAELNYIYEGHARAQLAGDRYFNKKCDASLKEKTGSDKALPTHSCWAALEIADIFVSNYYAFGEVQIGARL